MKEYGYEVSSELAYGNSRQHWEDMDDAEVLSLLSMHWSQGPGRHLKVRERALEELVTYRSVPSLAQNPLQEGAVLGRIGTTSFSLGALKERLTPLGIRVVNTINAQTTHVLIGTNPKTTKGLENSPKTLLSSQLLQAELDRLEQPYLQAGDKQTAASVDQLSELLLSNRAENILLALEIIKGGGFPKVLIPQAFLAMKLSSDKQVYQGMKDLLDKYLSEAGKKSIRRTLRFSVGMGDALLAEHLALFCRRVPDLDGTAIALQLYHTHKKGMQYLWTHSKDQTLRKTLLEAFMEGDTLSLHGKGVSLLPEELADYPQITKVNLQSNSFTTIPPVLSQLPNLTHLNIAFNQIKGLHPRLIKMDRLSHLNAYGGRMEYWNSPNFRKMTQLKELVLRDYGYDMARTALRAIREALPDCILSYEEPQ